MTDAEKLRLLADWFDRFDEMQPGVLGIAASNEVQTDLRKIADTLEEHKENT